MPSFSSNGGDTFFSPGRVALGHLDDQFLQVSRKTRPTPRSRLPTPKKLKTLAMPAQEGFGLDVDQSVSPGE